MYSKTIHDHIVMWCASDTVTQGESDTQPVSCSFLGSINQKVIDDDITRKVLFQGLYNYSTDVILLLDKNNEIYGDFDSLRKQMISITPEDNENTCFFYYDYDPELISNDDSKLSKVLKQIRSNPENYGIIINNKVNESVMNMFVPKKDAPKVSSAWYTVVVNGTLKRIIHINKSIHPEICQDAENDKFCSKIDNLLNKDIEISSEICLNPDMDYSNKSMFTNQVAYNCRCNIENNWRQNNVNTESSQSYDIVLPKNEPIQNQPVQNQGYTSCYHAGIDIDNGGTTWISKIGIYDEETCENDAKNYNLSNTFKYPIYQFFSNLNYHEPIPRFNPPNPLLKAQTVSTHPSVIQTPSTTSKRCWLYNITNEKWGETTYASYVNSCKDGYTDKYKSSLYTNGFLRFEVTKPTHILGRWNIKDLDLFKQTIFRNDERRYNEYLKQINKIS